MPGPFGPELLPRGWVDAVGFIRRGGKLHVAFPKVYDSQAERLAREPIFLTTHLTLLARTMVRYGRETRSLEANTGSALEITSEAMLDWLDAATELYDDYARHGLYWVKHAFPDTSAVSGSINWPRTMARGQMFLSSGTPIYGAPVRLRRVRTSEHPFHRLHSSVVDEISVLLTGRGAVEGGGRLTDEEFAVVRRNPERWLSPMRGATFSDRGKAVLRLIERYLESGRGAESRDAGGSLLCRAENFELIWEQVLRAVIHGGSLQKVALPLSAGRWQPKTGRAEPGIRPRVDFALSNVGDNGAITIFDAKDKPVQSGRRSGSEADHYKQILYALLSGREGVRSVLMFPTLDPLPRDGPLHWLGSHRWRVIADSMVHEVSAQYAECCRAYVSGRTVDPSALIESLRLHEITSVCAAA